MHYALGNVIIRNQKSPKVKCYYAFILGRKSFKPFLNDANFLKVYTNIFLSKYVGHLLIYLQKNMKGWSYKLEIWYVKQSGPAFEKTRK